ncbi:MAG: hypothetical protein CM1200mP34_3880 [Verrucomicrobiales bacterium]|nr:MAG: hypothetical protein CM1200mP34_3880 [Verrucomicrobiales bacterium]
MVLLPAPFGPRNPTTSPGPTENDTPPSPKVLSEALGQVLTSIMGVSASKPPRN